MAKAAKKSAGTGGDSPQPQPPLKDQHVQDIPHEEVKMPDVTNPEAQIKTEIAKFNLLDAAIDKMKQEYGALTINDVKDKTGYEAVKAAWQDTRSKRTGLEKKGLELRNQYKVITTAIGKEEDRLIKLLEPLESELHGKWKAIDDEKERAKKEKEAEEQRQLMVRVEEVLGLGMTLQDGFYKIGDTISMDVATLRSLPDDQYEKLKAAITSKAEEIKKLAQEEADRKQKEADEFKKQQDELKKQQDLLKQQQDQLRQQQEEMENQRQEAQRQITGMRYAKLEGIGMVMGAHQFKFDNGFCTPITVNIAEIQDMTGEAFTAYLEKTTGEIKDQKDKKTDHDFQVEKEKIALEKKKTLISTTLEAAGMGFSYTGQSFTWEDKLNAFELTFTEMIPLSEEEIVAKGTEMANKISEAKKSTEKAEKAQKLAQDKENKLAMTDKDRFTDYLGDVKKVGDELTAEDFKTKKHKDRLANFQKALTDLINNFS